MGKITDKDQKIKVVCNLAFFCNVIMKICSLSMILLKTCTR